MLVLCFNLVTTLVSSLHPACCMLLCKSAEHGHYFTTTWTVACFTCRCGQEASSVGSSSSGSNSGFSLGGRVLKMFTEIWTRRERGKRVSGHRKVIKGDKQVREKREMKGKEDGRKEKRKKYTVSTSCWCCRLFHYFRTDRRLKDGIVLFHKRPAAVQSWQSQNFFDSFLDFIMQSFNMMHITDLCHYTQSSQTDQEGSLVLWNQNSFTKWSL